MSEQIETSSKKGRGRARKSLELIEAMFEIANKAHPITGRGVGYAPSKVGLNCPSRSFSYTCQDGSQGQDVGGRNAAGVRCATLVGGLLGYFVMLGIPPSSH